MSEAGRRRLRSAVLRFALMIAVLVAAWFLYRESGLDQYLGADQINSVVDRVRGWWWTPLALIALWTLLSPLGIPATPMMLAGGVIFGPWLGTLYNLIGASLGSATSFLFAHLLGRDLVAHLSGEKGLARVEILLENHGFSSLLNLRLLPIPFAVVNFGAALAGMRFSTYWAASTLGLTPMIFVLTFFYASLGSLTTSPDRSSLIWLVGALALMAGFSFLRFYLRRRARQQS
jgi:uncharacterized membrane protein YdjX (TVP38/TMEM64 family)